MALPDSAPHPLAKRSHLLQHFVYARHDVLAIHQNRRTLGSPQRDMQHAPLLGDIDLLTGKHRLDPRTQTALFRQLHQQLDSLVSNAVLGIVQEDSRAFGRQTRAPLRVTRKQPPQMLRANLLEMGP